MLMSIFKKIPVTCLIVVLMWALWGWNAWHDTDVLLSTGLTVSTWGQALALTGVLAVVGAGAEWTIGSLRFALAGLLSHTAAVPCAYVVSRGLELLGLNQWGDDLLHSTALTPLGIVLGGAAFAAAFMPRLWQRRTLVVCFALPMTLVLYAGSLADIVGLIAAFFGAAAGAWATKSLPTLRPSRGETRVLVALLVLVVALGPVIVAFNPLAEGPFSSVTRLMWAPDAATYIMEDVCAEDVLSSACQLAMDSTQIYGVGSLVANLIPLLVQMVLCYGLYKGRRAAWWLTNAMILCTLVLLDAQLADFQEFGIALYVVNLLFVMLPWLLTLAVLWRSRHAFGVRLGRAQRRAALLKIGALAAVAAALWVGGASASQDQFWPDSSLSTILIETPQRLLPPLVQVMFPAYLVPNSAFTWFLYDWVGTLFWLGTLIVLYRVFAHASNVEREHEREQARTLVETGSGDHLSFMSLWHGNRYFFNAAGDGFVAYRAHNGVALTLGEPVWRGDAAAQQKVADEFESFAREQGLRPVWYSVCRPFIEERAGFKSLAVAEEAVLSTENTDFKGKRFQNIRTARNKAGKEGVSTLWTTWEELDFPLQERIRALSEEWVSGKELPEMSFTLGSLEEIQVPGTQLLLAVDEEGAIHGVTSWLPVRENGVLVGYTLDVMRRRDDGFRGVIELLVSEAMIIAAGQGCGWISLSGAPLAMQPEDPSALDTLLERVGQELEPLYGFRSLAASKRKFQPEEQEWVLGFDDELALPSIGLAVANAYVPELGANDARRAVQAWLRARKAVAAERAAAERAAEEKLVAEQLARVVDAAPQPAEGERQKN